MVIPEGKSSGWMVPDAYRDRFEVWTGDAKALLPKMVDKVDSIDFFYHDCNHTYDHMMFEFHEAKRKLEPGGLIVATTCPGTRRFGTLPTSVVFHRIISKGPLALPSYRSTSRYLRDLPDAYGAHARGLHWQNPPRHAQRRSGLC